MKLYARQKQQQRVVPRRLERRNAIKNIEYDASTSPSLSSFDDQFDDQSSHGSRSLDIASLADRTSFRIEGTEGEFDAICRRLGLSGPDDFAISTADWEKRRSYSPTAVSFPVASRLNNNINNDNLVGRELPESNSNLSVSFESKVSFSDDDDEEVLVMDNNNNNNNNNNKIGNYGTDKTIERRNVEGGIKGVRPPVLAPPPAISRAIVDNMGSNWELIKSFAPIDDEDLVSDGPDEEDLGLDGLDDAIDETRGVVTSRNDMAVSPSGSERMGDEDEGSSRGGVEEQNAPLSSSGSIRGGFNNWQKGDFLGSGSFGTVYEGFDEMGHFFAVKEVSLLDSGSQGKQSILQLEQEISLLSQFHHDNIVRYLGTDTDDGKLYIFLELVTKGSLAKLYQKYELRDSQVSAYTRQILSGLNYLHERKVVHRDIKCANILVDASGSVKLADFGLAKATTLNDIKSCKGTPYWMAPEVVNNRSNNGYGLAADIWSLGCTVLEMLTRKIPYSHLEGMQALFRIGRGQPPPIPDTLSTEAQDFILKCLQVNPNDRPTAAQLLDHPFLRRRTSMNLGLPSPHHNSTQL
ncbi:mitogen-activated protein kinase kinase kinase 1-like [Bidens hawaiensis]|uniref:mitogen-activated protein kinase kinase kinase 1-like n=1 Tax=Bidens hawaiensis TaxID=980011 RepID=UPI004049B857